jgi:hypothetical protein
MLTLEQETFLQTKKIFTTSEARKVGFNKKSLKKIDTIVCLGSFPQPVKNGVSLQSLWTNDAELAELVKTVKKVKKQGQEAIVGLVNRVEEIVRGKLGFNITETTEKPKESVEQNNA